MNKSKKSALFFVNSLSGGGAEKVCLNLALALYKQGINSIFITCYKSAIKAPEYIEEHCLCLERPKLSVKSNKKLKSFMASYIKTDFCLITAHLPMSWLIASVTPWSSKCIYVLHNYSMHLRLMGPLAKFIFGKTFLSDKKISCVSKGLCKWFTKAYHLEKLNVTTIYNPICIKKPTQSNSPLNFPYILVMGRLCYQKNQKLAIKIFSKLQDTKNLHLVIAGDGKDKKKLLRYVNKLNLADKVHFVSYQRQAEPLITNARLVLSTSRYEGFNMIVAESIYCNTPVVATDCKFGPSEILRPEGSEHLISSSKRQLPKSTETVTKSLQQHNNMQTFDVSSRFNSFTIINQYLQYFKKI